MVLTVPRVFVCNHKLIWRQAVDNIVGPYRNRVFIVNGVCFYMKKWFNMNQPALLLGLVAAADAPEYHGLSAANGDIFCVDEPIGPLELFHLTVCNIRDLHQPGMDVAVSKTLMNYIHKQPRLLCELSDGSFIYFGQGRFDKWCVFLVRPFASKAMIPLDADYFSDLKVLGQKYDNQRVYNDFVRLYDMTGVEETGTVVATIREIARSYEHESRDSRVQIEITFALLYAAMIAELHKEHAPLGKRIKRHGVHKLLMENYDVKAAADEDRKRGWREIDAECMRKGF